MSVYNNVPYGYDKPVLTVVVSHYVRGAGDSCAFNPSCTSIHTAESLKPGLILFNDEYEWAKVEIVRVTPEEIEVRWRDRRNCKVRMDDIASYGMGPDVETVWAESHYSLKLFYNTGSRFDNIFKKFEALREKHRHLDDSVKIWEGQEENDLYNSLDELKDLCSDGFGSWHSVDVFKRLLIYSDNWWTLKVDSDERRRSDFVYILNELTNLFSTRGDNDYLRPGDNFGWRVVRMVFENNDPAEMISRRDTFAESLAGALAKGNKDALAIFDKYAEALKKSSIVDYAYLMLLVKDFIVDRDDYPLIEKTTITPLPEMPVYDLSAPKAPAVGPDNESIVARLHQLKDIMLVNYDEYKTWKNIPLAKEADALMRRIPDSIPGLLDTPADKANLLFDIIDSVTASHAARFALKMREYIDALYSQCLDDITAERTFDNPESPEAKAYQQTKDNYKDNKTYLQKRRDYLDETITMEEFCEKYELEYPDDPIERSEEWERVYYEVACEVDQRIAGIEESEANLYAFGFLEQARVLKKYDIEWKDVLKVNYKLRIHYFSFNIQGDDYYTNNLYVYGIYSALSELEDCPDEDCLVILSRAYANMMRWGNTAYILLFEEYKKLIEKFKRNVTDLKSGKKREHSARVYALNMLEDIENLDGMIEDIAYEKEHPEPDKELQNEWDKLCMEVEELCAQGWSRVNNNVGNKMKEAEGMALDLIENYRRKDLFVHYCYHRCCDNWDSHKISNPKAFCELMTKAINEYGSFSPKSIRDWMLIQQLLLDNPVNYLIPDIGKFGILMEKALAKGDDKVKEFVTEIRQKVKEYIVSTPSVPKTEKKQALATAKEKALPDGRETEQPVNAAEEEELLDRVEKMIDDIVAIHKQSKSIVNEATAKMEQAVLDDLNRLIKEFGRTDLFIRRAALDACNNWHKLVLSRGTGFKMDVETGVEDYGSLAPDSLVDWQTLEQLSENNDPEEFMDDKEKYYDLLAAAMEEGSQEVCDITRDIMNTIWEPENCQEED